jgi:N-acetylneuraminic acid mutarotase
VIDIEQRLRGALELRAQTTTLTHPRLGEVRGAAPRLRRPGLLLVSLAAIIATVIGLAMVTTRSADPQGWRTLPVPPLAARDDAAAVWTGHQLLVWGGGTYNAPPASDGAAYDPASHSWTMLPTAPLVARHDPVSAWTGTEMIVWGGTDATGAALDDGAAYNRTTNTWRSVAAAPLDAATATFVSAVWTGSELIIWGGDSADGQPRSSGAAYSPSTDSWRAVAASPLEARHEAATVWTGTEMVVWGGSPDSGRGLAPFADGAAYNPTTDTWRMIAAAPLEGRIAPAVWTGARMIVVAGRNKDADGMFAFGDGAAYDPANDSWRTIADGPGHPGLTTAWTGSALIGLAKGHLFTYDPLTNTWMAPDSAGSFLGQGRILWTGEELLLVGITYNGIVPMEVVAAYTP